jgi:hypothetical protein
MSVVLTSVTNSCVTAFDGWWYVTLTEGGTRPLMKLLKAPNDKVSKALAERREIQELAARQQAAISLFSGADGEVRGHF